MPTHKSLVTDPWKVDFDPAALLKKYREERDRRLRSDTIGQYITIGEGKGAKYSEWLKDPWTPRLERAPKTIKTTALVCGAGFSGIQIGGQLKKAGVTDFKIMDRAGDFGGTWYWNRYPGAACDSEAYGYLPLLEEMNYMPTMQYCTGTEILQHTWRMAKRFGLYEHAIFQTAVKDFNWDDKAKVWRGSTDRGDTIETRFLITCGGPISHPHLPDVEGIDTFKGEEWHTCRWDYGKSGGDPLKLDFNMTKLKDKRVAIIGTGATAVQAIPFLGESCGKLYIFQRTPSAVDVRDNKPTDPKWWASLKPGWWHVRDQAFQVNAAGGDAELDLDDGFSRSMSGLSELVKRQRKFGEGKEYTEAEARQLADFKILNSIRKRCDDIVKDKRTAELLKPWYNLFCKRPVYSDTYLPTFNRTNVELVDAAVSKGIERITEKGIVVGGKEYEVDVIIWSTGFTLPGADYHDYRVLGRDGVVPRKAWAKRGGMATLFGIATNGFPNYFTIASMQAPGSVNFPSVYNDMAIWIAHVVGQAINRGMQTVEVTREAEEEWVAEVLRAASQMPRNPEYATNCTPGYYNGEGIVNLARPSAPNGGRQNRNVAYMGGPLLYRKAIYDYVAKNDLAGFHVTYLPGREARL